MLASSTSSSSEFVTEAPEADISGAAAVLEAIENALYYIYTYIATVPCHFFRIPTSLKKIQKAWHWALMLLHLFRISKGVWKHGLLKIWINKYWKRLKKGRQLKGWLLQSCSILLIRLVHCLCEALDLLLQNWYPKHLLHLSDIRTCVPDWHLLTDLKTWKSIIQPCCAQVCQVYSSVSWVTLFPSYCNALKRLLSKVASSGMGNRTTWVSKPWWLHAAVSGLHGMLRSEVVTHTKGMSCHWRMHW